MLIFVMIIMIVVFIFIMGERSQFPTTVIYIIFYVIYKNVYIICTHIYMIDIGQIETALKFHKIDEEIESHFYCQLKTIDRL